jgi:signal transduction histidine kinase
VLLNLKLGLLRRKVDGDPEVAAAVDDLRADVSRAVRDLRDLAHGIYPPLLLNDGLRAALTEAAERSAIPTTVDCDGTGRYPPAFEAAVYFCCLEALQNAAKHAGPDAHATVRLGQRNGGLVFEVADDGCGCDADAARGSSGMQNMADRVGALGGALQVASAPGTGTTVTGTVPLAA